MLQDSRPRVQVRQNKEDDLVRNKRERDKKGDYTREIILGCKFSCFFLEGGKDTRDKRTEKERQEIAFERTT